jgi:hypothetical protein
MSHDQRFESFGLWASYWKGFDACVHGAEPVLKSAARCNLELMSLASRRARAYADMSSRLVRCRSPQDWAGEQVRFWQSAAQDYADSTRSLMEAWSMALGPRTEQDSNGVGRDYITLEEPREEASAPARKSASRRAA